MVTLSLIAIAVMTTLVFYRLILELIKYALFASMVYVFLRGLTLAYQFDYTQLAYPIVGGVLGFLVVGVLCAAWIRHALIRFYLHEAIAKQKAAAKAGRLW